MNGDVLMDAGPLVALIDRSDGWHLRCRRTLENLRAPLLTVWPAVAEASHILKPVLRGQATLMGLLASGIVEIASRSRRHPTHARADG
jgi:predicted nucleic acid-binding protein